MLTLRLAWRNILRHRRRSLATALSVLTGVAAVILFGGFIAANYEGLRESVIRSQYGHVQIYRTEFLENRFHAPEKHRLAADEAQALDTLLARQEEVAVTARRIEFAGLLGAEKVSQAALVRAVEPDKEALISSALTLLEGSDLREDDPGGVLLGEGLARALDATVGQELTLLATTVDGAMNAVDVHVAGIFRSSAREYDDRAMMMPLAHAQSLLGTRSVDLLVVLLHDTAQLPAFLDRLQAQAPTLGTPLAWRRWDQLTNYHQQVVDLYDGFFLFVMLVVSVVVAFGIANTMMIAVMERTAEIGTLRALGTQRTGIAAQFLAEGLLLSCLGALAGVALGAALAQGITQLGWMMPPPPGSAKAYPLRIAQVPVVWAGSAAGVMLVALVAGVLPSWRAARRDIVEALRHV